MKQARRRRGDKPGYSTYEEDLAVMRILKDARTLRGEQLSHDEVTALFALVYGPNSKMRHQYPRS